MTSKLERIMMMLMIMMISNDMNQEKAIKIYRSCFKVTCRSSLTKTTTTTTITSASLNTLIPHTYTLYSNLIYIHYTHASYLIGLYSCLISHTYTQTSYSCLTFIPYTHTYTSYLHLLNHPFLTPGISSLFRYIFLRACDFSLFLLNYVSTGNFEEVYFLSHYRKYLLLFFLFFLQLIEGN